MRLIVIEECFKESCGRERIIELAKENRGLAKAQRPVIFPALASFECAQPFSLTAVEFDQITPLLVVFIERLERIKNSQPLWS